MAEEREEVIRQGGKRTLVSFQVDSHRGKNSSGCCSGVIFQLFPPMSDSQFLLIPLRTCVIVRTLKNIKDIKEH